MKSAIIVRFLKIAGQEVNPKLLKDNPNLLKVTTKTTSILADQIIKYFKEHKIETKVDFIVMEKDEE